MTCARRNCDEFRRPKEPNGIGWTADLSCSQVSAQHSPHHAKRGREWEPRARGSNLGLRPLASLRAGSGPLALCFGMWASRRCGRTRQMNKANGPEHPGPLRTWCSSLSTSVLAVVETMSSYLRRLSLRFLLTQISPTTNGENGPGGIRTHIRALTESCAAVAPRAL